MRSYKMKITVPEDHQLEVRLPDEFPPGPADVVFLTHRGLVKDSLTEETSSSDLPAMNRMLAALEELRTVPLSAEEQEVLDEFEDFQKRHPFRLTSLEEDP